MMAHYMAEGFKKGTKYTTSEVGLRELMVSDSSDMPLLMVMDDEVAGTAGYRRIVQVAGKMQIPGNPLQVVLAAPNQPSGKSPGAIGAPAGVGVAAAAVGAAAGNAGGGSGAPAASPSKILFRKKKIVNRVADSTFNTKK